MPAGGLNVSQTLQIDNTVPQTLFAGPVTAASVIVQGAINLGGGAVTANGNPVLSGTQAYSGAVTLSADTMLTGTSQINFNSTVDSAPGNNWGLTANAPAVQFFNNIGATTGLDPLGYLTTGSTGGSAGETTLTAVVNTMAQPGSTTANTGGMGSPANHNGDQDFQDAVYLNGDITISAAAAGGVNPNVTFSRRLMGISLLATG